MEKSSYQRSVATLIISVHGNLPEQKVIPGGNARRFFLSLFLHLAFLCAASADDVTTGLVSSRVLKELSARVKIGSRIV